MANVLANVFGASPVMPLEKHCEVAYRCARQLGPLFDAVVAGDWSAAQKAAGDIETLENQADDLKKEIRLHMPKSLFMPVPRQDLLELLLVQDRIANRARDISDIVMVRRVSIPESIADEFVELVTRSIDAAKQARKSVRELDELFTAGFRGAEVELVETLIEELDQIETETDAQQLQLGKAIFDIEGTLNPVDAVFLHKLVELVGDVADMAERVGRRLELLLSH